MSAFILAGIIFILTLGGIWLGTLLRRTLPRHHLNEHAKDVVRLGVGLIATIAALVLGLLIASAKGSFDTQTTQIKQITANLILLDSILAQYGPEARPIRQDMRDEVGAFADRLWREKTKTTTRFISNEFCRGADLFRDPKTFTAQRCPTFAPIARGADWQ